MKYLIATDGSPNANACIEYLSIGKLADTDLVKVLTVWDASRFRVIPARLEKEEAEKLLSDTVKNLKLVFGERVSGACIQGEVAASIIRAIQVWRADKILLGAHARTDLPEILIGNITQEILDKSKTSVVICRERQDESIQNHAKKILCCVDNVPFTETVFSDLPVAAELRLLHIQKPIEPSTESQEIEHSLNPHSGVLAGSDLEHLMDELIEKIHTIRPDIITNTTIIEDTSPGKAILNFSNKWQADLIITKSHNYTHGERILMSSVSTEIANNAKCSVQVIR